VALAFFAVALALVPAVAQQKSPLRVCLISGAAEYESEKSLAGLQIHLEKSQGMRCTRAFATSETDLPGLENLDQCDVAVLFTRRLKLKGDQLERLKQYCLSGKPLVGIRTASHAIQTWLDLDHEVLGGDYKGHYPAGPEADVKIVPAAKSHPVLRGVQSFRSQGSLYKNAAVAKDVEVLLTGSIPEHTEPVAWTRLHKGGRVFYTSLGHQKDFDEPSFVQLVVNAINWTAGK
jgi:type 1 glutamine amidotransferase